MVAITRGWAAGATVAVLLLAAPTRAPAQTGQACSVFRPCPAGFICQAGVQRCAARGTPAPAPAVAPATPASTPEPVSPIQTGPDGQRNFVGRYDTPRVMVPGAINPTSGQWWSVNERGERHARPIMWYSYVCEPGRWTVMTALSQWDNMLFVVTQAGDSVASNDDANNSTNAQIRFVCPDSQEYLVGVAAKSIHTEPRPYEFVIQW